MNEPTHEITANPHLYQCYDCQEYKWQPIFSEHLGCARCAAEGEEVGMRYLGYFEDELVPERGK